MKILQLCKKFPFPRKDGESIAVHYMAAAFAELGHEVTLLAMNTAKHWSDPAQMPFADNPYRAVHTVEIDNRVKLGPALRNIFSRRSYHIERFESRDFADKLAVLLRTETFDVVQLETLYLAPYLPVIRQHSDALVVLRAHNVEHEIWERVAAQSNPLKKWYLNSITPRLKKFETEHLNRYDLLVSITARDQEYFRRLGLKKPATVAPIGLDSRRYEPDGRSFRQSLSIAFIGSLDWMPNVEGLRWFLDAVWAPLLAPAFPDLQFHIAGRNTPDWLRRLRLPGVTVHGEVPDAAEFINRHSILLIPLLSGSGMRAKALEAMALGKVVLSTTVGLEGIGARPGHEVLTADTPQTMLEALRWCHEQADLEGMGARARAHCVADYDNLEIARHLLDTYRQVGVKTDLMSPQVM